MLVTDNEKPLLKFSAGVFFGLFFCSVLAAGLAAMRIWLAACWQRPAKRAKRPAKRCEKVTLVTQIDK
tara:strand:- start:210 stop:413 length:204 start_codon:yes stop_codon:yes gene_type:complete